MELPGYGVVPGPWDLRDNVDAYLGNVNLKGKRILEVGTASGFLCFEMEKRGAEVIACDLSEHNLWDIVPFGGNISAEKVHRTQVMIKALNNSWWLAHNVLNSKSKVVYCPVYKIPEEIGPVHIATFGCVLLHLRDPFLALQKAAAITTETMIVSDLVWYHDTTAIPDLAFYPDADRNYPDQEETWWHLSSDLVARYLKILGFPKTQLNFHEQKHNTCGMMKLYTVVGRRK